VWKRDEDQPIRPATAATQTTASPEPPRQAPPRTGGASIGPSIVVKGELSGDEDLFIHGQVDGSVALDLHSVTVGNVGRVKANITGRIITIEGVVEGNLRAQEQIILRGSAKVQGDLKAPRIVLEDGATFRGLIDMGVQRDATAAAKPAVKAPATAEPAGKTEAVKSEAPKEAPRSGASGATAPAKAHTGAGH
jgi:cytoskeletal protein CcmA (bactofilin family)